MTQEQLRALYKIHRPDAGIEGFAGLSQRAGRTCRDTLYLASDDVDQPEIGALREIFRSNRRFEQCPEPYELRIVRVQYPVAYFREIGEVLADSIELSYFPAYWVDVDDNTLVVVTTTEREAAAVRRILCRLGVPGDAARVALVPELAGPDPMSFAVTMVNRGGDDFPGGRVCVADRGREQCQDIPPNDRDIRGSAVFPVPWRPEVELVVTAYAPDGYRVATEAVPVPITVRIQREAPPVFLRGIGFAIIPEGETYDDPEEESRRRILRGDTL